MSDDGCLHFLLQEMPHTHDCLQVSTHMYYSMHVEGSCRTNPPFAARETSANHAAPLSPRLPTRPQNKWRGYHIKFTLSFKIPPPGRCLHLYGKAPYILSRDMILADCDAHALPFRRRPFFPPFGRTRGTGRSSAGAPWTKVSPWLLLFVGHMT